VPARCFLAIDLPAPAQALLGRVGESFVESAPSWARDKWVHPALMHVTVRFVGALPDPAVPRLTDALAAELSSASPFSLRLAGVRAVPAPRRASMLWAGLDGDVDASREVHACVERVLCGRFGVEPDHRAYSPHVTLVRARAPRRAPLGALTAATDLLSAASFAPEGPGKDPDGFLSVRSITLYASTLGRGGPQYERLGEVPLGGT
jgi:RNA 2',3'-cyclic 3'-phosphodiesterase